MSLFQMNPRFNHLPVHYVRIHSLHSGFQTWYILYHLIQQHQIQPAYRALDLNRPNCTSTDL